MATEMPSTSKSSIQLLQESSVSTAAKSNGSPTILRIKRRIDEDPAEALLLKFKRWKGDDAVGIHESQVKGMDLGGTVDDVDVISHIVRFAGTVKPNENHFALDEQITTALLKLENTVDTVEALTPKVNARGLKRRMSNTPQKSMEENQIAGTANRFRLVPNKRPGFDESTLPNTIDAKETIQAMYNLYDVVEDCPQKKRENKDLREPGAITCNGLPLVKESLVSNEDLAEQSNITNYDYVYDLYVSNGIITSSLDDHYISFEDMEGPVQNYREFMSDGCSDEEFPNNEDEDSNDEGNWRNDYPDSDPDEHGGDDSYFGSGQAGELGSYIDRLNIDEDSSSDDEDYCSPLSTYKSYKRRVFKELDIGFSNEVISSENTEDDDR